jgi:tyrosyl-tRNA synthetase
VDINELKILLANKATEMLHGAQEAKKSEETAKQTFTNNSLGENLPLISVSENALSKKLSIIDLIILSKFENSKSEIRRLIKGNGIRINNLVITDEKLIITKNLFQENFIKLSLGKKKHIKVKLN